VRRFESVAAPKRAQARWPNSTAFSQRGTSAFLGAEE
jgi:hypothetical protein